MIFLILAIIFIVGYGIQKNYIQPHLMDCWHARIMNSFALYLFYLFLSATCFTIWVTGLEEKLPTIIYNSPAHFKEICVQYKEICFPIIDNIIIYISALIHCEKKVVLYCCDMIGQTDNILHFCNYDQKH